MQLPMTCCPPSGGGNFDLASTSIAAARAADAAPLSASVSAEFRGLSSAWASTALALAACARRSSAAEAARRRSLPMGPRGGNSPRGREVMEFGFCRGLPEALRSSSEVGPKGTCPTPPPTGPPATPKGSVGALLRLSSSVSPSWLRTSSTSASSSSTVSRGKVLSESARRPDITRAQSGGKPTAVH